MKCQQRRKQQTHAVLGCVGCQQIYEVESHVGPILDKLFVIGKIRNKVKRNLSLHSTWLIQHDLAMMFIS